MTISDVLWVFASAFTTFFVLISLVSAIDIWRKFHDLDRDHYLDYVGVSAIISFATAVIVTLFFALVVGVA